MSGTYATGVAIGTKYRLEHPVGEGAVGTVWVATNTTLDAPVAIKIVHRRLRSAALASQLLGEAQAAAKLQHHAVVRIFDFGETSQGDAYLVMELLEGESLRSVLDQRGAIGAEEAVRILLPIADGIHAAHERGVVHRDVKPDNIVLARTDAGRVEPKVVDFGVGKLGDANRTSGADHGVIGTPEYMPPEQALGHAGTDHRVDVWALSAVLYECVAGRPPFPGATLAEAVRAVVEDPLEPLSACADVDDDLSAIVARGLARDPDERWPTMRDLGQALARWLLARGVGEDISGAVIAAPWLDGDPEPSAGEPPRSRRGASNALGFGLAFGALAVSGLLLAWGRAHYAPDAAPVAAASAEPAPAMEVPARAEAVPAATASIAASVAQPAPAASASSPPRASAAAAPRPRPAPRSRPTPKLAPSAEAPLPSTEPSAEPVAPPPYDPAPAPPPPPESPYDPT